MNYRSIRTFSKETRDLFIKTVTSPSSTLSHPRFIPPSAAGPAPTSAVLVPLVHTKSHGDAILFTKRSIHLKSHRGEICFPGGRIDKGESVKEVRWRQMAQSTALRETFEEIGIPSDSIDIWGEGKPVLNRQLTGAITPIIGQIGEEQLERMNVNGREVQTVFSIPLSSLLSSREHTHFVQKSFHYTMPLFRSSDFIVHFNAPYATVPPEFRVWGLSAIMLHYVLSILYPTQYSNKLSFKEIKIAKPKE